MGYSPNQDRRDVGMFRMEDSMLNKMRAPQDTEKRGQEIYERRILPLLEPAEKGKFVAIDIHSRI